MRASANARVSCRHGIKRQKEANKRVDNKKSVCYYCQALKKRVYQRTLKIEQQTKHEDGLKLRKIEEAKYKKSNKSKKKALIIEKKMRV